MAISVGKAIQSGITPVAETHVISFQSQEIQTYQSEDGLLGSARSLHQTEWWRLLPKKLKTFLAVHRLDPQLFPTKHDVYRILIDSVSLAIQTDHIFMHVITRDLLWDTNNSFNWFQKQRPFMIPYNMYMYVHINKCVDEEWLPWLWTLVTYCIQSCHATVMHYTACICHMKASEQTWTRLCQGLDH